MGLKEWVANTRADAPVASFGHIVLQPNNDVKILSGPSKGRYSLKGAEIAFETGADLQKRVTFTRFMAVGLFSLAIKKKSGGEKWLLIHGDGFDFIQEVPAKQQAKAQDFFLSVRQAIRAAG